MPRRSRPVRLDELGTRLVPALVFWFAWAHRKVESVALLEGDRGRRRVSVDLTVPDLPWPLHQAHPEHCLVPLGTFATADMRQFDASDAAGNSVPVLGTQENVDLTTAFLVALIKAETGETPPDTDLDEVRRCAGSKPAVSGPLATALVQRLQLANTFSAEFLVRLADEFILFAVLPADRIGTRTVVKFSYHWSVTPPKRLRARFTRMIDRVLAGFGLRPYVLAIDLGRPETAASIHLDVPAPAGLHAVGMSLYNDDDRLVALDASAGMVAHSHASSDDLPVRGTVRFDPDLAGVHRVVTWSTWGVALLLLATRWRLHTVALEPSAPVSLLLFGPALLLTWLVRPGENWIVSEVIGPLRAVASGLAMALFAVAFGLSIGFDAPPYASAWGGLADVGWTIVMAVAVAIGLILALGRLRIRARLTKGDDYDVL